MINNNIIFLGLDTHKANSEFSKVAEDIAARLQGFNMPEVEEFLSVFVPSYQLTLDELLNGSEKIRNLPLQNK